MHANETGEGNTKRRVGIVAGGRTPFVKAGKAFKDLSLDKARNQWQNSRILMLTRAGRVTRWRLSGKSRTDRVCPCFPMFLRWLRSQDVAR